jgi:hypothetical protein
MSASATAPELPAHVSPTEFNKIIKDDFINETLFRLPNKERAKFWGALHAWVDASKKLVDETVQANTMQAKLNTLTGVSSLKPNEGGKAVRKELGEYKEELKAVIAGRIKTIDLIAGTAASSTAPATGVKQEPGAQQITDSAANPFEGNLARLAGSPTGEAFFVLFHAMCDTYDKPGRQDKFARVLETAKQRVRTPDARDWHRALTPDVAELLIKHFQVQRTSDIQKELDEWSVTEEVQYDWMCIVRSVHPTGFDAYRMKEIYTEEAIRDMLWSGPNSLGKFLRFFWFAVHLKFIAVEDVRRAIALRSYLDMLAGAGKIVAHLNPNMITTLYSGFPQPNDYNEAFNLVHSAPQSNDEVFLRAFLEKRHSMIDTVSKQMRGATTGDVFWDAATRLYWLYQVKPEQDQAPFRAALASVLKQDTTEHWFPTPDALRWIRTYLPGAKSLEDKTFYELGRLAKLLVWRRSRIKLTGVALPLAKVDKTWVWDDHFVSDTALKSFLGTLKQYHEEVDLSSLRPAFLAEIKKSEDAGIKVVDTIRREAPQLMDLIFGVDANRSKMTSARDIRTRLLQMPIIRVSSDLLGKGKKLLNKIPGAQKMSDSLGVLTGWAPGKQPSPNDHSSSLALTDGKAAVLVLYMLSAGA